jgi:hypothetical protein
MPFGIRCEKEEIRKGVNGGETAVKRGKMKGK